MHAIDWQLDGRRQCFEGSPAIWQRQRSPATINDGEMVGKKKSPMCTKSARLNQMVGSVPADRRRLVTEALHSLIIFRKKKPLFLSADAPINRRHLQLIAEIIPDSTKNSSLPHRRRIGAISQQNCRSLLSPYTSAMG